MTRACDSTEPSARTSLTTSMVSRDTFPGRAATAARRPAAPAIRSLWAFAVSTPQRSVPSRHHQKTATSTTHLFGHERTMMTRANSAHRSCRNRLRSGAERTGCAIAHLSSEQHGFVAHAAGATQDGLDGRIQGFDDAEGRCGSSTLRCRRDASPGTRPSVPSPASVAAQHLQPADQKVAHLWVPIIPIGWKSRLNEVSVLRQRSELDCPPESQLMTQMVEHARAH